MKIVLATLSRNIYSGWALYIEGYPASKQISAVTLDHSVSHLVLTRSAVESLNEFASGIDEIIDLYVVDDRQRSGLNHPSVGGKLNKNVFTRHDPPTAAMIRKARTIIEDQYRLDVRKSPFDGDPRTPFLISTAVEIQPREDTVSAFGLDPAGTGVVIAAAGDIHTARGVVRVPRHDIVVAELIAIHSGLILAMKELPSFRSAREHAVVCTTSQEALEAIAYPWGGSKARRIAAGKVIEQLNRIKCGDKRDQYGAIFRVVGDEVIPYQDASHELARISLKDFSSAVEHRRFHRRNDSTVIDAGDAAIRAKLMTELGAVQPQPFQEVIPESPEVVGAAHDHRSLFHFPSHVRRKGTRL